MPPWPQTRHDPQRVDRKIPGDQRSDRIEENVDLPLELRDDTRREADEARQSGDPERELPTWNRLQGIQPPAHAISLGEAFSPYGELLRFAGFYSVRLPNRLDRVSVRFGIRTSNRRRVRETTCSCLRYADDRGQTVASR